MTNGTCIILGKTYDESNELIATSQICSFILSAGEFNGKRNSNKVIPLLNEPNRHPDSTVKERISVNQVMNLIFLIMHALLHFSLTIGFIISRQPCIDYLVI